MIERVFLGWNRTILGAAAEWLQAQYRQGQRWDLSGVTLALPGRQAGRRLRQILKQRADEQSLRLRLPEILTPADLPETLYTPPCPLASPTEMLLAWMGTIRALSPEERQSLSMVEGTSNLTADGMGLAGSLTRARAELMAEGISFAEAAARGAWADGEDDPRGLCLALLERQYLEALQAAGLCDRDTARAEALRDGKIAAHSALVLIGAVDLGKREREFLRAVSGSVVALVPAPPDTHEGFDDVGVLVTEYWAECPLPLRDDSLTFPADPAAEAQQIAAYIHAAQDAGRSSITVGLGDERIAEDLTRRLRVQGIPTRSPFGRLLLRTRPGALLESLREYLFDRTARSFASTIRHPDLETWLVRTGSAESAAEMASESLLTTLDTFRSRQLPERLPTALPPRLEVARKAVETLVAPLAMRQPLPAWTAVLTEILRAVYDDLPESDELDSDPEETALRKARAAMAAHFTSIAESSPHLAPAMSGAEALGFVLSRLRRARLPDDAHPHGIEMMGWLELALDDASTLLLTGLHEGAIPGGARAADLMLPELLRQRMELPNLRRRQARDAFLLRLMTESRPHVALFAARRGAEGEPRRPSRLLFFCDGETAARRARRFTGQEPETAATQPLFSPGTARRLSPPLPEPLLTPFTRLRVTAFRDYLACPYRFYLKHGLKLRDCDDSAEELDAPSFGNLLHECLNGFAHASCAHSSDVDTLQTWLRDTLTRLAKKQFGYEFPAPVRLQLRQGERRLDAFAHWQAEQTASGWQILSRHAEHEIESNMVIDGLPFTLTGRLDRVDYHHEQGRYRIIDYKTGDSGGAPEEKHRGKADPEGRKPWIDLQLPLYRLLAATDGIPTERLELGYVVLPSELGNTGYRAADWSAEELQDAEARATDIIRALRQEIFWPPSLPSRYTDAFSALCLDRCRDREQWFLEASHA